MSTNPTALYCGVSLKPRDATIANPYDQGRFAPDQCGMDALTFWCPHCGHSAQMTEVRMVPRRGLFIEAICYTCTTDPTQPSGIYKRVLIPCEAGDLPRIVE